MPGRTATETAEIPDTKAKTIATSLHERGSPIIPIIVILLHLFPARLLLFSEAELAEPEVHADLMEPV